MEKKIIDINEITIKKYVESIRPESLEIRNQIDFGYSFNENTVEIYEIRPLWNDPTKIHNSSFAKIRFYKSTQLWKLYWMLSNGKWKVYKPFPESTNLDQIIEVIQKDENGCFLAKVLNFNKKKLCLIKKKQTRISV